MAQPASIILQLADEHKQRHLAFGPSIEATPSHCRNSVKVERNLTSVQLRKENQHNLFVRTTTTSISSQRMLDDHPSLAVAAVDGKGTGLFSN